MVRIGIVGLGNMGIPHAKTILSDKITNATLAAVCDFGDDALQKFPEAKPFKDSGELIRSGEVDAIVIATPHYAHTTIGIDALENGLHVLVEKPISVHKADCERLIAAHKDPKQVFAAMFNQRTDPYYQKIHHLITSGELGALRRVNWTITDWFRTERYYSSGGWRATWGGEGGGVLLNQCPHNLDLFQWMFGLPVRVRANCALGKYHNIEVEDDVTAYVEFANGATGTFIASTGEAPGTNRLEIVGERGKLVYENDTLSYTRNVMEMSAFSAVTETSFDKPEAWQVTFPSLKGHGGQHTEILQNFIDAIHDGKELIAPAPEGIHSIELANAMLLSSFEDRTIELPLDSAAYEAVLKKKIASSTFVKKVVESSNEDFSKSFAN